ncbi:DUF2490 domain-containing protein [Mucilaginibacter lacusdianchii]|uniref:DUF2490 domain-containing protein n=1 Tax=Mucilaginibacter lacusdianchii TaxID=2684211 RepID=UPI00131D558C|nr:DUF2490 domain-containing protein [Mucilaginibacter sp. JXJ CY 39]
MKKLIALIAGLIMSHTCLAQLTENMGWLFITHQQKLSKKLDLLADVQLRSANQFDYLTTLLLRTGVSYNFDKKHSAALGYAYKGDWEQNPDNTQYTLENRLFEQYIYQFKLSQIEVMLRARLEQRFVKEENVQFSQRARGFVSAQIPLIADADFNRGLYTGIQNEIFVNVQHQQRVNNNFFDQNRSMVSIGYRWSKHIDSELGYLFWYQPEKENAYRRNVIQLMFTTKF